MSKKRDRTEKREQERAAAAALKQRERIASLSPGGDPQWPLVVQSPVLIEAAARRLGCAVCSGPLDVVEHEAKALVAGRRRLVRCKCVDCGQPRDVWFAIAEADIEN